MKEWKNPKRTAEDYKAYYHLGKYSTRNLSGLNIFMSIYMQNIFAGMDPIFYYNAITWFEDGRYFTSGEVNKDTDLVYYIMTNTLKLLDYQRFTTHEKHWYFMLDYLGHIGSPKGGVGTPYYGLVYNMIEALGPSMVHMIMPTFCPSIGVP
ncbi:unnamed protein product [marine sediment metagenome]|uniref:Uncharacterized protein n=2 Tax=marine sediment metagenome TaxID=412755 RepID=X1FF37_9ZZZZ